MRKSLDIRVLVIAAVFAGYLLLIIVLAALSAQPDCRPPQPVPPHGNGAAR